jgi:segregation and condensation protein B
MVVTLRSGTLTGAAMAFDLKRVLKVMLFASNGALGVKDIQTAFTRFHEQETALPLATEPSVEVDPAVGAAPGESPASAAAPVVNDALAADVVEAIVPAAEEDDMYRDVPSLVTSAQIREAMEQISLELQAAGSEVLVVEGHSGWRLVTHPRFARWVRLLRNEPPPVRLTASAIETLAVIAYRQPATRAEIEKIRGVSAEAGITKLLERDLIYVVGRADLPGRPIQFGTTDGFLEFVGIKSLDELPASDVLSPRQIDAWLQTTAQPTTVSDSEMGLDEAAPDQLTLDQAATSNSTAAGDPERVG